MKFFKQLHRKFYDATIRTAKPCHESRVDSAVLTVRLAHAHEVIEGLKRDLLEADSRRSQADKAHGLSAQIWHNKYLRTIRSRNKKHDFIDSLKNEVSNVHPHTNNGADLEVFRRVIKMLNDHTRRQGEVYK